MIGNWKTCLLLLYLNNFINLASCIQCNVLTPPLTRLFSTLVLYQGNKITFDVTNPESEGNFVKIEKTKDTLEKNDFLTFQSNYIMRLILTNNRIRSIEDEGFFGLHCVDNLQLQENKIEIIKPGAFKGLDHLISLNLSNNFLESLPEDLFQNLPHMRYLDLSKNMLKVILSNTFSNTVSLSILNMTHNQINYLNLESWKNSTNIHILDASYNGLREFDFSVNINFMNLTRLMLNANQLKDINIFAIRKHAPHLALISLEDNPWLCDDLNYILKGLKDSQILYKGTNKTVKNVDGIDCYDSNFMPTSTVITPTSPDSYPFTYPPRNEIRKEDIENMNSQIIEAISALKTIVVCMFIFMLVVIVFTVVVKAGVLDSIFGRRHNLFVENSSRENIRLLPANGVRL